MSAGQGFGGVLGLFASADGLHAAASRAREAGIDGLEAYLPVGDRASLAVLEPADSPVRWVALAGGLTGIATALALTIGLSWNYPLVVGGKPITSWPPFLIICFELMVLFGGAASIIGFLWFARLPDLRPSSAYRPEVAVDRFALLIACPEEGELRTRADGVLREAGALEVREVRQRHTTALERVA